VLRKQLFIALLPLAVFLVVAFTSWHLNTRPGAAPAPAPVTTGDLATPAGSGDLAEPASAGGLQEPPSSEGGLKEPPAAGGLAEPPAAGGVQEPPGAAGMQEPPGAAPAAEAPRERSEPTRGFWIGLGVGAGALLLFYGLLSFQRLEVFKMLLGSFFPLLLLILSVLGSIVLGLATPTEAAAVGAFGGYLLAAVYAVLGKGAGGRRRIFGLWLLLWSPAIAVLTWFLLHEEGFGAPPVPLWLGSVAAVGVLGWVFAAYRQSGLQTEVKESVLLTAKTSAMVCWLFVGSAIFSAAFALLGGQELVEKWVMSLNLSKTEFLVLSQVIIFILGWPLEWTEIIVIFMPIFIPLLDNFGVDPLFFGLLVALNLQTAFLSPPVAMAAFYLKGVSPPHVTLNQIFAGMIPFMGIQIIAIVLLYNFPAIGMWLPEVLYR
jgi:TRAP-type mannitol/chloroaromatic compound transport system permease large subunit